MIADFRLFPKSIRTLIDKISTLTHSSPLSVIGERDSGNVYFRQKKLKVRKLFTYFFTSRFQIFNTFQSSTEQNISKSRQKVRQSKICLKFRNIAQLTKTVCTLTIRVTYLNAPNSNKHYILKAIYFHYNWFIFAPYNFLSFIVGRVARNHQY